MKDRRRFLAPRDLWDAGTIEAWLEEKAAQGWILEKWGISARFERIDPCRCRVRLDPKDRRNRQQQAEAETLYRDMGWRWNGTLWFYDVYYCFDPTAPDLYTDPETQAWAWGKLLKRALWRSGLSGLLLLLWAALQFDGLWSGHAVQLFLMGMWAIWLFVILYVVREVWEAVRTVWGIRRLKRRLAAGVPMERGDPARAVRRQRIRQIADWTAIALLAGWILVIACGREEMPLSDAPEMYDSRQYAPLPEYGQVRAETAYYRMLTEGLARALTAELTENRAGFYDNLPAIPLEPVEAPGLDGFWWAEEMSGAGNADQFAVLRRGAQVVALWYSGPTDLRTETGYLTALLDP